MSGWLLMGLPDGLAPGSPAVRGGLGHNGPDDVDQLGQARGPDPVGVPQQADEQPADDEGVGSGVDVLDARRGLGPVVGREAVLDGVPGRQAPHVPLIDADLDPLGGAVLGAKDSSL